MERLSIGQIRSYVFALFGTPGDDYPVTYIRDRDYVIITDKDTLASPKNLI